MTFRYGANWWQFSIGFAILWFSGLRFVLDLGPFWIEIEFYGPHET